MIDVSGGALWTRASLVALVLLAAAVVGSAVVLTSGASSAAAVNDPWTSLRRPLHLPKLAAGANCPLSRVDRRVAWKRTHIFGGSGIGRGPVYPGLPSAFIMASRDEKYGGRWFGSKVFWYVLPSYRGPALIRGRRLDGAQMMGFNGRKRPTRELHIKPNQSVSWQGQPRGSRGVPSDVRVLKPGCYGLQIDGTSFSRFVVISVDTAN